MAFGEILKCIILHPRSLMAGYAETKEAPEVAFEFATSAEEPHLLNVGLNTVARFINMHAQAGVPLEKIRPAIVVHGPAGWDLLDGVEVSLSAITAFVVLQDEGYYVNPW